MLETGLRPVTTSYGNQSLQGGVCMSACGKTFLTCRCDSSLVPRGTWLSLLLPCEVLGLQVDVKPAISLPSWVRQLVLLCGPLQPQVPLPWGSPARLAIVVLTSSLLPTLQNGLPLQIIMWQFNILVAEWGVCNSMCFGFQDHSRAKQAQGISKFHPW